MSALDLRPSGRPARFKVFDRVSPCPSHVFELHLEHGQLCHDEAGHLDTFTCLTARQAGLAQVTVACFGIWIVVVGAHCDRPEAREIVQRWAAEAARYVGAVREKLAAKALGVADRA